MKHRWTRRPERCDECGGTDEDQFVNEELEFDWPDLRLTGHCDGILAWSALDPDAEDEVLELKTASDRSFDSVNPALGGKPYQDHVIQLHCYMAGTGLRRGRIVYIRKGDHQIRESLVEHEVAFDDALWERICDLASKSIEAVQALAAQEDGEPAFPPRLDECAAKRSRRASRCPMCDLCFGTKP